MNKCEIEQLSHYLREYFEAGLEDVVSWEGMLAWCIEEGLISSVPTVQDYIFALVVLIRAENSRK
ncbi:MAG: hypothetical protein K8R11_06640 [Methanococcoides sp.]|nr:hypothetical protein [Methanococcoides sp.]